MGQWIIEPSSRICVLRAARCTRPLKDRLRTKPELLQSTSIANEGRICAEVNVTEKPDPDVTPQDNLSDEPDRVLTTEHGDPIPDTDGEPILLPPKPQK